MRDPPLNFGTRAMVTSFSARGAGTSARVVSSLQELTAAASERRRSLATMSHVFGDQDEVGGRSGDDGIVTAAFAAENDVDGVRVVLGIEPRDGAGLLRIWSAVIVSQVGFGNHRGMIEFASARVSTWARHAAG